MTKIEDIKQIDRSTPDGRLLWAALVELTTKLYPNLTPYQVLAKLEYVASINEQEPVDYPLSSLETEMVKSIQLTSGKMFRDLEQYLKREIETVIIHRIESKIPVHNSIINCVEIKFKPKI